MHLFLVVKYVVPLIEHNNRIVNIDPQSTSNILAQDRWVWQTEHLCLLHNAPRAVVRAQRVAFSYLRCLLDIFVEKLLDLELVVMRTVIMVEQMLAFLVDTALVFVYWFVDTELLFGG